MSECGENSWFLDCALFSRDECGATFVQLIYCASVFNLYSASGSEQTGREVLFSCRSGGAVFMSSLRGRFTRPVSVGAFILIFCLRDAENGPAFEEVDHVRDLEDVLRAGVPGRRA